MTCLLDNDLLLKLALCDLLNEALAALGVAGREVFVLPTARFVLLRPVKKPDEARARLGAVVHDRLQAFLETVQQISVVPSPEEQRVFDDVVGIDAGEAVLFSATAHYSEFILATSDKRSLRALAETTECRAICQRMAGRVISFEQILLRVVDLLGFEAVRAKVVPALHCDSALRAVFGSGLEATEETVRMGLHSYIGDLQKQSGDLLVAG